MTGSLRGTPPQAEYSSTGSTRGHRSDDVTTNSIELCDNLTIQVGNDIKAEAPSEQTQRPILTTTNLPNNTNKRKKLTIKDKVELYRFYCKAASKGLKATAGTYTIWREKHPID